MTTQKFALEEPVWFNFGNVKYTGIITASYRNCPEDGLPTYTVALTKGDEWEMCESALHKESELMP